MEDEPEVCLLWLYKSLDLFSSKSILVSQVIFYFFPMSALITPIAGKVTTSTTTATTTLARASQYVVFSNVDATSTNSITININGAPAVANEGIHLKGGQSITVNLKDIGGYIKSFSTIAGANTPILAYMAL